MSKQWPFVEDLGVDAGTLNQRDMNELGVECELLEDEENTEVHEDLEVGAIDAGLDSPYLFEPRRSDVEQLPLGLTLKIKEHTPPSWRKELEEARKTSGHVAMLEEREARMKASEGLHPERDSASPMMLKKDEPGIR